MTDCSAAYPVSYNAYDTKSPLQANSVVSSMCAAVPTSSSSSASTAHLYQQLVPCSNHDQTSILYQQLDTMRPETQHGSSSNLCQQPLLGSLPPHFASNHSFRDFSSSSQCNRIPSFITLVNHVRPNPSRTSALHPMTASTFVPPPPHLLPTHCNFPQPPPSQHNSLHHHHSLSLSQPQPPPHSQQQSTLNHLHLQPQQHTDSSMNVSQQQQQRSTTNNQSKVTKPTPLPLAAVAQAITAAAAASAAAAPTAAATNRMSPTPNSPSEQGQSNHPSTSGSSARSPPLPSKQGANTRIQATPPLMGMQLLRTRRHNSAKAAASAARAQLAASERSRAAKGDSCFLMNESSCSSDTADAPVAVVRRNERERNRVRQVNQGFQTLRAKIPNSTKKMSKVQTLRCAVHYIRQLQQLLNGAHVPIEPIEPYDDDDSQQFFDLSALFE
jgi:hypothetical protein